MRIGGIQKMTLQDYPGQVAAIGFTAGCQLRCPYCHNPALVFADDRIDHTTEFMDYLIKRRSCLDGVVITGGEPLIHADIIAFLADIKALDLRIKLDTNGFSPLPLKHLLDQQLLDYVAMDFKNIPAGLAKTIGWQSDQTAEGFERWQASLRILETAGITFELRTTVVKGLHTADDLIAMAEYLQQHTKEEYHWFLQSFKRSDELLADRSKSPINHAMSAYSLTELKAFQTTLQKITPTVLLRE